MSACRLVEMTAPRPGAIGVLQLIGDVAPLLASLTGSDRWPRGRLRLVSIAGIDELLVGRTDEHVALLMPHGGPRVIQQLRQRLLELGAERLEHPAAPPAHLYPEAADACEALMLQALARAESPLAVELLLEQPRRWRRRPSLTDDDRARARRLDRLITAPLVALAGPPNVGKSTLTNALAGRSVSIAHDEPGTTRDYTVGRINLGGFVVHWHDTPGRRATADPIEADAIRMSEILLARAELLIAMTDATHDWPTLPRPADLRIAARADLGPRDDADLMLSAARGDGLDELVAAVRERLVPAADLAHPGPWLFDERLLEG